MAGSLFMGYRTWFVTSHFALPKASRIRTGHVYRYSPPRSSSLPLVNHKCIIVRIGNGRNVTDWRLREFGDELASAVFEALDGRRKIIHFQCDTAAAGRRLEIRRPTANSQRGRPNVVFHHPLVRAAE